MKGTAFGVGVGPGDPEYMTLKAIRLIKENEVFAFPAKEPKETVAYKIAVQVVPELADKELIAVDMPMVKDRELIRKSHEEGAKIVESYLDQGKNVVYLTLGDPTVYCTFSYIQHILEADGYPVELVSGISSITAAAAKLCVPIAEWDEAFHVVPAVHKTDEKISQSGTYVLMKSASHMKEVKDMLRESGRKVYCAENCSMETEKLYYDVEEIPDDAGYFSLIIAKENK